MSEQEKTDIVCLLRRSADENQRVADLAGPSWETNARSCSLKREAAQAIEDLRSQVSRTAAQSWGLDQLQAEQREWAQRNFGDKRGQRRWVHPLMGVVEEVGELSHALLKQDQGIRGSWDAHEAEAKDAVGDIMIYLADLCSERGWDMNGTVREVWERVCQRDWTEKGTR